MGFLDDAWNGITGFASEVGHQAQRLGNFVTHSGVNIPQLGISYQPTKNWADGADWLGYYPAQPSPPPPPPPPPPPAYTPTPAPTSYGNVHGTAGLYGNGADVAPKGYITQASPPPPPPPPPPAPSYAPSAAADAAYGALTKALQDNQANAAALRTEYQNRLANNPYNTSGQAFQNQLGVNRDTVARNYSAVPARLTAAAGQRGLGNGAVGGALSRALVDEARAQSDANRQTYADYTDKAAQYELGVLNDMAQLNGDYTGALSGYGGLLSQSLGQLNQNTDAAYRDRALDHTISQDQVSNAHDQQRIDLASKQLDQALASGDRQAAMTIGAQLLQGGVKVLSDHPDLLTKLAQLFGSGTPGASTGVQVPYAPGGVNINYAGAPSASYGINF